MKAKSETASCPVSLITSSGLDYVELLRPDMLLFWLENLAR